MKKIIALLLIFLSTINCLCVYSEEDTAVTYKEHVEKTIYKDNLDPLTYFSFNDLERLSQQAEPDPDLKAKLDDHLSMVFLVNRKTNAVLDKPYIRVAHWNINRGLNANAIKDILINPALYQTKYIKSVKHRNQQHFKEELNTFSTADIICLNEADIGMPRTEYKNIVSYLADPLGWNYAYSTEFIELGPLFQKQKVDKDKYKGLHGNVIISKFPIVNTEILKLPNYYDWYREETKKRQSPLEHFRRFGAKLIFRQYIEPKEVRHGGRSALIADIKLPNDKIVTVVSAHLEDRAYCDQRFKQFQFLLNHLKSKTTPVILAGDLNTSTTDTKPTSVKKEFYKRLRDPHFILRATGSVFVPGLPIVSGLAAIAFSKLLQYKDPIFPSIPIIFPNHERKLFNHMRKFRFNDGGKFDISGDRKRSSNGRRGLLANSNQRHWKGFKSTFKLEEPRIIAYFKTDWFLIKPLGNRFYPFNGKTLKTLNRSYLRGISDHNPITVDIKI